MTRAAPGPGVVWPEADADGVVSPDAGAGGVVSPDALIELGPDRRVVAVNDWAARLIGRPPAQLTGQACGELLEDGAGAPVWVEGWPPASRFRSVRRVPEQRLVLHRPDGRRLPVTATASFTRHPDGSVLGAVLAVRNDAGRKRADGTGAIEIVSTVSHELRSPLTSVKGFTSLMLNRWDRLTDEQKRMMLEQVNHDADRVTRLITELLDISRLETGRLVLRRQLVDLSVLAASVVGKVHLEYADLEAEVSFPDAFPRVYADPDKLEQVLTNLVENACKYASPLGLRIIGARGTDEVTVGVTDRGAGIPASDLPQVFDKFFRRSEGKPTGSGLGLWISRGLVEAHGGSLVATSQPGIGSTFSFTLPLIDLDEPLSP